MNRFSRRTFLRWMVKLILAFLVCVSFNIFQLSRAYYAYLRRVEIASDARQVADRLSIRDMVAANQPVKFKHKDEEIAIKTYQIGELNVTSGKIAASDGFLIDVPAFAKDVPPGKYPVLIAVAQFAAGGQRNALARVQFSSESVARWEMALPADVDHASLQLNQFVGYGVDSGTGAFYDASVVELVNRAYHRNPKILDQVMAELGKRESVTPGWVRIETRRGNEILFSSGFGDGTYCSLWGYDQHGNLAALVTDFDIIDWHPFGRPTPTRSADSPKPSM